MPLDIVKFTAPHFLQEENMDCILVRRFSDSNYVEIAFPFHEDTPNLKLSISEAMTLRNTLSKLLNTQFLDEPR